MQMDNKPITITGQPALMHIVDKCLENLQPGLPFIETASKVTALDAEFRVRDILQVIPQILDKFSGSY